MSINSKVIEVVDTALFKEQLQRADVVLPFVTKILTNKKNIANFLGVHPNTISNYIKNGTFKEGVHYTYLPKGKLTFIPLEIIDFKINKPKIQVKKEYVPCEEAKELLGC
jgi:hypothetical protein